MFDIELYLKLHFDFYLFYTRFCLVFTVAYTFYIEKYFPIIYFYENYFNSLNMCSLYLYYKTIFSHRNDNSSDFYCFPHMHIISVRNIFALVARNSPANPIFRRKCQRRGSDSEHLACLSHPRTITLIYRTNMPVENPHRRSILVLPSSPSVKRLSRRDGQVGGRWYNQARREYLEA